MRAPQFTKRITRDSILFTFGLLGVTYQTIVEDAEKPTLLILFGACLGLPVFLRADERAKEPDEPPVEEKADA